MSLLVESTLKVSLIVLMALAATALLRRRSAAVRHWLLTAALGCAAAVPLIQPVMPSWNVEVDLPAIMQLGESASIVGIGAPSRVSQPAASADSSTANPAVPRLPDAPWAPVVAYTWAAGAALSFLLLFLGLARLTWLASRAHAVSTGRWADLAAEISEEFALRRPVALLQSRHPTLLVTWGIRRPKVILPASAVEWSDDRMRVVLLHELAHISRGDWATQLAAECLRATYWFNPLVWLASKRLRQESEHACDDAVLNGGIDAPEYATHLLALARSIKSERRAPFSGLPAPAMARPSSLERRFSAMLNRRINRAPITRTSRLTTIAAVAIVSVLVAGLGLAQTFSTFSGSIVDPSNRVLPGVTLLLTNSGSGAKYEIASDSNGRFEFVGLPPGDYTWEARLVGFSNLKGVLAVSGRNVQRDLSLQLGNLEETISVVGRISQPSEPSSTPRRSSIDVDAFRRKILAERVCSNEAVGGNIKPPVKLRDVRPRYAASLQSQNISGVVELDARINPDGDVAEVSVLQSVHPDLDLAASDAVKQWQFSPTLLNCEAVDVRMKVHVSFRLEP
jgi:TonB family protein